MATDWHALALAWATLHEIPHPDAADELAALRRQMGDEAAWLGVRSVLGLEKATGA